MSSLEVEILIVNSTLSTVPVLSLIGCWKDDTLAFQHSAVSWGNCLPKLYQITCFKPQGRNGTTPRSNLQPQVSPSPMLSADEISGACGRLGRSIAKWPGFCEVSFNTKTSSKYVHLGFVDVFHGLCMFMIVYVSCHYRVNECGRSFSTWKIRCLFKNTA